jgi:hypothetical protein
VATVTIWSSLKPREGVHEAQERRRHPLGAAALFIFLFINRRLKDVRVFQDLDGMGSHSMALSDLGNCRLMN